MQKSQREQYAEDILANSMLQEIEAGEAIANQLWLNWLRGFAVSPREKLFALFGKKKEQRQGSYGDMDLLGSFAKKSCERIAGERTKINEKFANFYASQYRGSYLLNYNTIIIAVLLAVLSMALLYLSKLTGNEHTIHNIHITLFFSGIAKFVCLLVILINTKDAKKYEFNRRSIEYRYLSEQLRCVYYMQLLGARKAPKPSSGRLLHGASIIQSHLDEVINSLLATERREAGAEPESIVYDRPHLLRILQFIRGSDVDGQPKGWIQGQIQYHNKNIEKNRKLNEKLEHRIARLNMFVIIAVAVDIIIGGIGLLHMLYHITHFFHDYITVWILATATIVPAYVASRNGLLFQSEARKQEMRSEMMLQLLRELDKRHASLINRVDTSDSADNIGSYTREAIELVNETAQVMIDEVAEWAFLSNKDVPEP